MIAPPFAALLAPLGAMPYRPITTAPSKPPAPPKYTKTKNPHPRNEFIFSEYMSLASTANHSAFAAVPNPEMLRKTHAFLQSRPMRIHWKRGEMKTGCAKLALRLDMEWPEWAMSRTNVFGLLLSPIFDEFYYYLEDQPNHDPSNPLYVKFEQCLMRQGEYRHRTQWWATKRLPMPGWCDREMPGGTTIYVGHPYQNSKGITISWRRIHLAMIARRLKAEDAASEGYVYV
ncbi:hypothetical protein RhiJN_06006 [Ceratobasidium sp. AG-Ba]|nr:hypothetical protein RhiJN_06006 [Ceratobasidium sp. AG-Ba]QRW06935.1 hypothetical protein RhiLY_05934 [Ceratobasidium sp. AG-Ba]